MSHKVVYNACYGGFSLSLKAVDWLEENCEDNELSDFIKSLRLAGKEYSFASKDEYLRYDVSGWFDGKRHHKDLIAVVETLGHEANGPCVKLEIMEISGNQYRIDEYDGSEEVITPEDSDWIFIND